MTVALRQGVKLIGIQRHTHSLLLLTSQAAKRIRHKQQKQIQGPYKSHKQRHVGAPLACIPHRYMFMSTILPIHGYLQCFTMAHIHVYESSNDICVCRVTAVCASSVSIQVCMLASVCTSARLHMHACAFTVYLWCVQR